MTRYGGTRALDAEIKINFTDNTILMDYSTVRGRAEGDSNGDVLTTEWRRQPLKTKMKYIVWVAILCIPRITPVFSGYCVLFTALVNRGVITSSKTQYDHQRFLQYYYSYFSPIVEESVSGEIKDTKVVFSIWSNLYIDYELKGEYQEKIQSISLIRNYVKVQNFRVFSSIRQWGWNVIFEFTEPPKSGGVIIRYIG